MSDTDKTLRVLNDGRMAGIVLEHCEQMIEQAKKLKIEGMANQFRAGTATHDVIIAGIASFCALDDLERDLNRKITKGNMAAASIHKEEGNGSE